MTNVSEYKRFLYEYHYRYSSVYRDYYNDSFIREFAHPFRRICTSPSQLWKQIMYYNGEHLDPAYISVYSYKEAKKEKRKMPIYDTAIIDKIFFDFDSSDINESYSDALKLYEFFDKKPTLFFSGKKGCHLFAFLAEISTLDEVKKVVEAVKKLGLKTWDDPEKDNYGPSQSLDLARVSRIPYTLHQDTGLMMIPINTSNNIAEIVTKSSSLQIPVVIKKEKVNIDRWL